MHPRRVPTQCDILSNDRRSRWRGIDDTCVPAVRLGHVSPSPAAPATPRDGFCIYQRDHAPLARHDAGTPSYLNLLVSLKLLNTSK